ncbi:glycoside hydrolase family 38 N-terminal domain-containing protein [Devosia sp. CAU 1758]
MTEAKRPLLHLIGNAHLDPVWLWRWQEGCAEAIGTCWAAIDRLREGEGFVFTKGEAHIYRWIEELEPALFAEIRRYVAEGRWIIVNGWWIQPDCNVPNGESVIRQALYGKGYFMEKFGFEPTTGYNVDSFGHPGTFPMLLRHTGFTSYTFMRPGPHEMDLPGELFTWQSPDGSALPAFRIQDAYNTSKRSTPLPPKIDQHYAHMARHGHDFMCFYGVGNHGGAPTIENIAEIESRLAAGEPVTFSDPERFFREVDTSDLPVVVAELQFHAIGCYSVASSLKALNRKAESLLEQAEAAYALAQKATGTAYPAARFAALWQVLLFNQFHDTLGGTSIETACVDSERELAGVIAGAEELLNAAVRRLDGTIAPPVDPTDATFVVMNFTGVTSTGLVEAEPWVDKDTQTTRLLLDEDGKSIPFQYIDPAGKTTGLQRLVFLLEVPAYGHRVLRFTANDAGIKAPGVSFGRPHEGLLRFETAGYTLELSSETGAITSLVNRESGIELFTAPGHLGVVVDDPSDTWTHGTDRFGFSGRAMQLAGVRVVEDGPVRTTVESTAVHGLSMFTTLIVLPTDPALPVELRVTLDWREQRKLLRLAYPLGGKRFEYEVPGGWESRPDTGREVPGQRWVRVAAKGHDVAVINDAKYSYAADDGTLYITAVRAPIFAHHDPIPAEDGARYRYMDQGEQSFTILLHAAPEVSRLDAATLAERLNKPVVTTPHVSRGGAGDHNGQWLRVESKGGMVTALKGAEDSDGLIMRALDLSGVLATVGIGRDHIELAPREISTLRLRKDGLYSCDGLERQPSPNNR